MDILKIAGIDVSRGNVTVCVLSEVPYDLRRFKRSWKAIKFKADREGIAGLLALEFDGALMEPSGGHYSRIWAYHLEQAGKIVRWVGHREIAHYRESWKEINKTDKIDAIVLACYGLERWNRPQYFIQPGRDRIKELYFQLEHLNRIKNPTLNRLRQQLCHEWPEVAERELQRSWLYPNPQGLWRAVASEKWSNKWTKEYQATIGTGISAFSQHLAQRVCEIERQEFQIEQQIDQELKRVEFRPYIEIFERYAISGRTSAALLGAIYPIERFLENGRVITDHVSTDRGRARRNRSLSSLKLACGLGMISYQSGDKSGWTPGGSSEVRIALWRWCKVAVIMNPNLELEAIVKLREYYEQGSTQDLTLSIGAKPGKDETWLERTEEDGKLIVKAHYSPGVRNQRVQRVVRRMLTMLFKDLIKSCVQ